MRNSSGCSVSARRDGHGWNTIVPRLAAQTTAAISVTHSSSACRPLGKVHPRRLDPLGPAVGHPLLVDRLARRRRRETAATCTAARNSARTMPGATAEVVVDQVELGLTAGREVHLVGVRDADRAPLDVQLDRGRGCHGRHATRRRLAYARRYVRGREDGRRMARATVTRGVRGFAAGGHRAAVRRRVHRHQDGRRVPLPSVRRRAVPQ